MTAFEKYWEENDIWKHDPYISENKNIEKYVPSMDGIVVNKSVLN